MVRKWLIEKRGNRTQIEIAELAHISQNHYSWIENGHRRPSPEVAKKIAEVLGFDWTRFFEDQSQAG